MAIKLNLSNSKLIKFLFSTLLIGLPVLVAVEAKADMHTDMPQSDVEMEQEDSIEPESGAYDSIDDGYDGEPVVTIPEEETIEVIVKNNTNAAIDYQAIGYTENQTLEGGEKHTMTGLSVPVVIRAARQDDGFVTTEPMVNQDGVLEISLDEASERNVGVVRIEEDGGVYIDENSETDADASMESDMSSEAMESDTSSMSDNLDEGWDGEPIANVRPSRGTINVRLKNETNAAINYQAIGHTKNRTLEGGEKHTMIRLPLPVVIRSARQDDGFIKILLLTDEDTDGVLEVSLDEDPKFYDDDNIGVVRIEEDGNVYVN